MAIDTTAIRMVAIRAVGVVDGNVDVSRIGTPTAIASLTIGTVLARVDRRAAQRIAATWRDAALHLDRLAENASAVWTGPDLGVNPVGVVVRFGPDVVTRQDLMPPTTTLARTHLRIQVGPLVWQVIDQAAYTSTRDLWERAERTLT